MKRIEIKAEFMQAGVGTWCYWIYVNGRRVANVMVHRYNWAGLWGSRIFLVTMMNSHRTYIDNCVWDIYKRLHLSTQDMDNSYPSA